MIRYLLGEHPKEFVIVWELVALTGAGIIKAVRKPRMSMAEQVKFMNEHRESRSGVDTRVPAGADQDPEMAQHAVPLEDRPEWMS